jgi:proline utilization trans-activator
MPYDLEALFVSGTNLLLAPAIDPSKYAEGSVSLLHKTYAIFDDMISSGNLVAEFREAELRQLEEMLSLLNPAVASGANVETTVPPPLTAPRVHLGIGSINRALTASDKTLIGTDTESPAGVGVSSHEGDLFDNGFTREQILDIAGAINDQDMAWMYTTMMEHNDWL